MSHVALLTHEAIYRGTLCLTSPGGQRLRFLDVLRAPQRVFPLSQGACPSLHLTSATRQCRRTGASESLPGAVYLHTAMVLAAYDPDPKPRDLSKVTCEQRAPGRGATRVVFRLQGDVRLEGTIVGGSRSLESLYSESFVACTDVLLAPVWRDDRTRRRPFLAVNTAYVESVCVVDVGSPLRVKSPAVEAATPSVEVAEMLLVGGGGDAA